jgi:hypothetical protein
MVFPGGGDFLFFAAGRWKYYGKQCAAPGEQIISFCGERDRFFAGYVSGGMRQN